MAEENERYTGVSFRVPTEYWEYIKGLAKKSNVHPKNTISAILEIAETILKQQLEGNKIISAKKCTDGQGNEILVPQKELIFLGHQPYIPPKENTD